MFGAEFRKLLKVFIERGDQSSFDIETKIRTIVFLVTVSSSKSDKDNVTLFVLNFYSGHLGSFVLGRDTQGCFKCS